MWACSFAFTCPATGGRFQVAQSFRFDAGIMRRYLRLGLPSGSKVLANMATFNLFLLLFSSYGVVQGAAMAIVFNWDMLSFIPMIGLNISVMSLIGWFVGMADMARANQVISSWLHPGAGLRRTSPWCSWCSVCRWSMCPDPGSAFDSIPPARRQHDDRPVLICWRTPPSWSPGHTAGAGRHPLGHDHANLAKLADAGRPVLRHRGVSPRSADILVVFVTMLPASRWFHLWRSLGGFGQPGAAGRRYAGVTA